VAVARLPRHPLAALARSARPTLTNHLLALEAGSLLIIPLRAASYSYKVASLLTLPHTEPQRAAGFCDWAPRHKLLG